MNEPKLKSENQSEKQLDDRIMEIWPDIEKLLKSSELEYSPHKNIKIESNLSHVSVRTISWMLFDCGQFVYRGKLECSSENWMVNKEFSFPLPESTKPRNILKFLTDRRFSGNPPQLTYEEGIERSSFYVHFQTGKGLSWSSYSEEMIIKAVQEDIDITVQLNELARENEWNLKTVRKFLDIAEKSYG